MLNITIRRINGILLCVLFSHSYSICGLANEADGLDNLSIEELMGSKVISATRNEQQLTDTAAAAYVISQDDIRRSGATTIPEALRMVPGLHVARVSASKWAVSARGFNGQFADKILVLMDGRSLYSPIHKGVYWEIQDRVLDDIERIEVIRGPGASVWGANAVNGVINLITKHSADTKEGNLTAFAGDKYGVGLRQGFQLAEKGYARVYGKFLNDNTFANRIGGDANEEWTSGRGGFRADWANDDGKHALMAQGDFHYGKYNENIAKSDVVREDLNLTFRKNRIVKKGGNILARWNFNQSLASRMQAQFFYDAFQLLENRNLPNEIKSEVVDFDFQHILALNEAHEFTWGLNYRLSLVQLKPVNVDGGDKLVYFPETFKNNRFGVFFQDKWRWRDDVEITVGSKFEHHNNNDFEYEPSLRILWKTAKQHRLWAGVSRAVRLPSVTDLPSDPDFPIDSAILIKFRQNQKLPSDEVISYELGYRYWDSDRISLDVAAYYNQYNNGLMANPEFENWYPERLQGIKKSSTLGLEATLSWRPLDWARFQISSSFMDLDVLSKQIVEGTITQTTIQDPKFLAEFRSSFDITPEFELDFWLRYADGVSGIDEPQAIPSYVALDARLAWKPSKNVALAFVANNLNDPHHPEFYDGLAQNPLQAERMFWLQGNLKY